MGKATVEQGSAQFNKIQFIGTAISTTPSNLTSIDEYSDYGFYAGLEDEQKDIEERISLIRSIIEKIVKGNKFDKDPSTLKIIVFPEFLMRGTKGAYLYQNLLPFVQSIIELVNREDILLVIGSILSSEISASKNTDFYNTGDDLLNIYFRLHQENGRKKLKSLLKRADEIGTFIKAENDDAFDEILVKTLEYSDIMATQVIRNCCYIVGNSYCNTVLKQYKSKEDFILNTNFNNSLDDTPLFLQTTTKYAEINETADSNGSVFEYGGIKFGIEICLDHKRKRLKNLGITPVDVQIIPSCGMKINPESVVVREGGYVFNCDGEYELDPDDNIGGENGTNSHTSLCTLSKGALSHAYAPIDKMLISQSDLKQFYRNDSYTIHFYETKSII